MHDRKEIAKGCFAGGAIFMAISLWLYPVWWATTISTLAGCAAGYLGYKFQDVYYSAKKVSKEAFKAAKDSLAKNTKKRRKDPGVSFIVCATAMLYILWEFSTVSITLNWSEENKSAVDFVGLPISFGISVILLIVILGFIQNGCYRRKEYFRKKIAGIDVFDSFDFDEEKFQKKKISYLWFGQCFWTGLAASTKETKDELAVFFGALPEKFSNISWQPISRIKRIAKGACYYVIRFFLIINDEERIVCSIAGPLGGLLTWKLFLPTAVLSFGQNIFLTICGGIISVALGVALCELAEWIKKNQKIMA